MVRIRTVDELILNTIDFYKTTLPLLDTKPGSVARDLFVDGPSTQLSLVYEELARIKTAQSIRLSLGTDLDKLGNNFKLVRKQGSAASGTALFTFNEIEADIPIEQGDLVVASNGATFRVSQGVTVSVVNISQYRATASKYRADLDFVGITDQYAVEVLVESTSTGILGNISKYSLISSTTPGVSNVTNTVPFSGGSSSEQDQAFKNRILSVFSGANTGTALGYRNAVLADPQVIDAIVIEPGDPLMTRDGTVVNIAEDGTRTIVSEGTGGKVDIYIQGVRFVEILDSYIYRDKSSRNDPTDLLNTFVLGQIDGDEDKIVSRKRIDNLEEGILPDQPVNNIVQVSGSISGPNFVEKYTDDLGRVFGNYELLKDTGVYGGSPWGFDKLHWIDNTIRGFTEEQTKGRFNGQDALTYPDVSSVSGVQQNIQVQNENSIVSKTDRSSIQLAHSPITSVTRVLNLTTGERYVISSQNPDGDGAINKTGRVTISGNTLPATSDILQVDYTWVFDYDPGIDFYDKKSNYNPRDTADSVDWGFSNAVSREESIVQLVGDGYTVEVQHPISSVINVNTFDSESGTVSLISGRLGVVVTSGVNNVISVKRSTDSAELFNTSQDDGSFSGFTVFLPTDTIGKVGDLVDVVYNAENIFNNNGVNGSFSDNIINLPPGDVVPGTIVEVSYISNVRTILPQTLLSALPVLRAGNSFNTLTASNIGVQPSTFVFNGNDVEYNLRKAASRLQFTIAGQISPGTFTVSGTTVQRVESVIGVTNSGLRQELSAGIKKHLGLSSTGNIPSNIGIIRVVSIEKVQTNNNMDVLAIEHEYDIQGYSVLNNDFDKRNSVKDTSLTRTQIGIPSTVNNLSNAPSLGDKIRVVYYISTTSDSENVSFSKSGVLSTQKRYAIVDSIAVSSGFSSAQSQTATVTVQNMNQPSTGSRYTVEYDYIAPKPNERITIRYNKNAVITDSTFSIENVRPISADVLAKASTPLYVVAHLAVVVSPAFINSANIVKQNVIDAVSSALNATKMGTIVDESDLINICYQVNGVDRVRVIRFNLENLTGRVLSIKAQKNEYIQPGLITVDIETR